MFNAVKSKTKSKLRPKSSKNQNILRKIRAMLTPLILFVYILYTLTCIPLLWSCSMFLYPTSIPIPFDILLKTPLTVINIYSKKTGKLLDLLVSLKLLLIIILLILFISGIEPNPGPKQGSLKIGCWNLNSILAREKVKINQIEALQSESKFHIFGICESWLSQSNLNSEIEIDGFSNDPFRSDNPSSDTHRRGGVCMYYDPNLPITNRKDLCLLQECIVAEIKLGQTKVFCILAYRSPNQSPDELSTFINKLESMFDKIQDENPSLIILLGDLNARSLQPLKM